MSGNVYDSNTIDLGKRPVLPPSKAKTIRRDSPRMADLDKPPATPEAWTLDDIMEGSPKRRVPITSTQFKRGDTEMVSFRAPLEHVVKMQIIIEQRRVAGIQTRSDIMNDAVFMWLERFYEDNPTFDPAAAQDMKMIRLRVEREHRATFLNSAQTLLEGLVEDQDTVGIDQYLVAMVESKYDYVNRNAPKSFVVKLDSLIDRARRLIDESK
jgi:hypothetical protein